MSDYFKTNSKLLSSLFILLHLLLNSIDSMIFQRLFSCHICFRFQVVRKTTFDEAMALKFRKELFLSNFSLSFLYTCEHVSSYKVEMISTISPAKQLLRNLHIQEQMLMPLPSSHGTDPYNRLCSIPIPLAGRHGNTQTNKPLKRDDGASQNCLVGGTGRQTVTYY